MADEGWLTCERERGLPVWLPSDDGRRATYKHWEQAQKALPESPQHLAWREAHQKADAELPRLWVVARASLREVAELLEADVRDLAKWRAATARLRVSLWAVGAASYCLFEWDEPGDDRADIAATPHNRAVRNWRNWSL